MESIGTIIIAIGFFALLYIVSLAFKLNDKISQSAQKLSNGIEKERRAYDSYIQELNSDIAQRDKTIESYKKDEVMLEFVVGDRETGTCFCAMPREYPTIKIGDIVTLYYNKPERYQILRFIGKEKHTLSFKVEKIK